MSLHPTRWLLACSLLIAASAAASAAAVPLQRLPPTAVAAAVEAGKGDPLQFAAGVPVNLDTASGAWDEPRRGLARWRLAIESAGASSLSLRLEDLRLPVGATLYWIGEQRGDVQGPFGPGDSGTLWLPLVRDSHALLEARMPASARGQFGLRIAEAYHGYRAFAPEGATAKGSFGDSGSCNIDSSCGQGDAWRQQVRSVVLLEIPVPGSKLLCTGSLVNNTARPGRALILTANHCRIRADNVESVKAYFNVVRPCNCSQVQGRIDQNIRGATFLARDSESDFTLFELASAPPPSFNPFYSGWDASGTAPQSGVTIHHPSGDDKKISVFDETAVAKDDQPVADFTVDAWQVQWSSGTTEAGSSGAGLWNQNRHIVGVLSGGNAACDNRGGADFFGRLDRAWNAGTAPNRLRDFLAPDSERLTFNGLEGGSEPLPQTCPVPASGGGGALPLGSLLLLTLLALRRRPA